MGIKNYCVSCKHENDYRVCVSCARSNSDSCLPSMYEAKEAVNHPDHYKTGNFECIDVMLECFGVEAVKNFCLLNAFKYLYRCEHKEKRLEDIKKGMWYLEKFIELESANNGKS